MRRWLLALVFIPVIGVAADDGYVRIAGGEFRSALKYEDTGGRVTLAPFRLMRRPVTNADFTRMLEREPGILAERDEVAQHEPVG